MHPRTHGIDLLGVSCRIHPVRQEYNNEVSGRIDNHRRPGESCMKKRLFGNKPPGKRTRGSFRVPPDSARALLRLPRGEPLNNFLLQVALAAVCTAIEEHLKNDGK